MENNQSMNEKISKDNDIDSIINNFFDNRTIVIDPFDNLSNINIKAELFRNNINEISDDEISDNEINDKENDIYTDQITEVKTKYGDISIDKITKNDIIIGIDLGTTNSSAVVWRNNNYEIIPDEFGNNTIPSIVAFTNKSRYIGQDAKNQTELNPKNVLYEVKRLIGRKITDESVKNDQEFLTYDISGDNEGNILLHTETNSKKFTPEEASAMILSKLKNMACEYLKKDITKTVITVPAYFNDAQRQATKDAATIAGLDCIRIINEPTAAALAYGLYNRSIQKAQDKDKDINILVYDFGGGTLDVSVLNISDGLFEVLGSVGNTHLGGVDFDNRLMRYCLKFFKTKHCIEKLNKVNTLSIQKLKRSCENAKKILSTSTKATVAVKDFYDSKDMLIILTRENFVELCKDLLLISIKPLEDVLEACKLQKDDINEIILVGGMTRMPAIRENIKNFFNGKEANCTINPDEAVSIGAAIQGYKLSHEDDPFSESMTLLDIISLSLGVETLGGIMNTIIERNTIIPITKTKMYTTDSDFETSVLIKIFEGERKLTKDNFFVGEFELKGIEPQPRGLAKIEVKFTVDVNGIITVKAIDSETNSVNGITITGNKGRLKQDQILKLVQEAKEFELKDKIERIKKQYYYEIDDLCSNIKYNANSDLFKLYDGDKKIILDDMDKVEKWMKDKSFFDREEEEYKLLRDRLKKTYGILMLKTSNDQQNTVKPNITIENNATTVYGNDDEEEELKHVFEKIENEELGFEKMSENEKNEVKQLRECLRELCDNLFDMLASKTLKISEDHIIELKDHIDDILLWMHVHDKATKSDYKIKIDYINNRCDEILKNYEDDKDIFAYNEIITCIQSARDELEQLCYLIKSSISNNLFSTNEKQIESLSKKVDETLEWLLNNVLDNDDEYKKKTEEINDLCNFIYNETEGTHLNRTTDIFGNDINTRIFVLDELPTVDDEIGGTSVEEIMRRREELEKKLGKSPNIVS